MLSRRPALFAAGVLLAAGNALAASPATTTFGVSATVAGNCLVSAEDLDFGTYDGSAAKAATSDLKVRCTKGLPYTVKLSTGGGTFAQRLLSKGTDTLQYNLFTTAALGSVWGDGSGSTAAVTGSGLGLSVNAEQLHVVHGSLPNSTANQDAPVGNYSDTITVTVEY